MAFISTFQNQDPDPATPDTPISPSDPDVALGTSLYRQFYGEPTESEKVVSEDYGWGVLVIFAVTTPILVSTLLEDLPHDHCGKLCKTLSLGIFGVWVVVFVQLSSFIVLSIYRHLEEKYQWTYNAGKVMLVCHTLVGYIVAFLVAIIAGVAFDVHFLAGCT